MTWKSEESREKERKLLEEELLPELESNTDYNLENWREEVEKRQFHPEKPEEYGLPYEVLGAPGGPYALYEYFLVDEGQDVEDYEFKAAINQTYNRILCNDFSIEQELKELKGEWENQEYLRKEYREGMEDHPFKDAIKNFDRVMSYDFSVSLALTKNARQEKYLPERQLLKEDILPGIMEELEGYKLLNRDDYLSAMGESLEVDGQEISTAFVDVREFQDREYAADFFVANEDLDFEDISNGYFGFTVALEERIIELKEKRLSEEVKELKELWQDKTTLEYEEEVLIAPSEDVETTDSKRPITGSDN